MQALIEEKLQEVAKAQSFTHYGELADLVGLDMGNPGDRNTLAEPLGTISRREHEQGRPLISAIVWVKGDYQPGPGFFKLARELGACTTDNDTFLASEVKRVWAAWR